MSKFPSKSEDKSLRHIRMGALLEIRICLSIRSQTLNLKSITGIRSTHCLMKMFCRCPAAPNIYSTESRVQRMPHLPLSTHQWVVRMAPSCSLMAVGKPNWKLASSSTPDAPESGPLRNP